MIYLFYISRTNKLYVKTLSRCTTNMQKSNLMNIKITNDNICDV